MKNNIIKRVNAIKPSLNLIENEDGNLAVHYFQFSKLANHSPYLSFKILLTKEQEEKVREEISFAQESQRIKQKMEELNNKLQEGRLIK